MPKLVSGMRRLGFATFLDDAVQAPIIITFHAPDDPGNQYRTGIYWGSEAERQVAEASKAALLKSGLFKEVNTEVKHADPFYLAEDYHQDYYKKNPIRYKYYRLNCGRDAQIKRVWKTEAK